MSLLSKILAKYRVVATQFAGWKNVPTSSKYDWFTRNDKVYREAVDVLEKGGGGEALKKLAIKHNQMVQGDIDWDAIASQLN